MEVSFNLDDLSYAIDGEPGPLVAVKPLLERIAVLFERAAAIDEARGRALDAALDALATRGNERLPDAAGGNPPGGDAS